MWRWPEGFVCPAYSGKIHCIVEAHCGRNGTERKLFQCNARHKDSSQIVGTMFHSTKLPLTTWLLLV